MTSILTRPKPSPEEITMSKAVHWAILAVVLFSTGACAGDTPADPPAADVVLRVIVDGEVAADWTIAELKEGIAFVEVTVDGDAQNGPRLLDVLAASGVEDWQTAEVIGMGEGRTFEVGLDITAAEVDDSWILDVTNRETLKLAADGLARERWVRDVGEIRIP